MPLQENNFISITKIKLMLSELIENFKFEININYYIFNLIKFSDFKFNLQGKKSILQKISSQYVCYVTKW